MRRGFLRWRNSDSDLPFWKRKTLLSPRTYSLPCDGKHGQICVFSTESNSSSFSRSPSTNFPPRPQSGVVRPRSQSSRRCAWLGVGNSASVDIAEMGNSYLAGVDPLAGERIVVRSHVGGGCRVVVVGDASSRVRGSRSIFAKFFGLRGCGIGLRCDRLRRGWVGLLLQVWRVCACAPHQPHRRPTSKLGDRRGMERETGLLDGVLY